MIHQIMQNIIVGILRKHGNIGLLLKRELGEANGLIFYVEDRPTDQTVLIAGAPQIQRKY